MKMTDLRWFVVIVILSTAFEALSLWVGFPNPINWLPDPGR
jgi:hypothetical protein